MDSTQTQVADTLAAPAKSPAMQQALLILKNPKAWLAGFLPETIVGLIAAVVTLIVILILYKITSRLILRALREQNRTEAQIKQFATMWKYVFLLLGIIFVVVSMSASLAAMGLTAAFVTMILGWSLQRPVTGVAAWLMVMIKRPFVIGDRIIIQGVRGDVLDIFPHPYPAGRSGWDYRRGRVVQSRYPYSQCGALRPDGHQLRRVRGSKIYPGRGQCPGFL